MPRNKDFACPDCKHTVFHKQEVVEQTTKVTIGTGERSMIVTDAGNGPHCTGQMESKFICAGCYRLLYWTRIRSLIEAAEEKKKKRKK